jgi:hypothetical protein
MITVTYTSIDGVSKTRRYKNPKHARAFAITWVGPQDAEGGSYAVSNDGVGKVTWTGITRAQLFGHDPIPAVKLNTETTFYAKGDDLFCRQKGYTHDHERQLFARVVQVPDAEHYYPVGWSLRHVDQLPLFDEDKVYHHRNLALAEAKNAYLSYLEYCEAEDAA